MQAGSKNGNYKTYDREGHQILDGNFLNGKMHGDNTAYYPTGEILHRFKYKEGKKIGTNYQYYRNGKIKTKEIASANGIELTQFNYNENEALLSEKKFKNEKPHGLWITYFDGSKNIKIKETYENGKLNGIRYTYYANGTLAKEETLKFDLLAGPFKTYYENGALESMGIYKSNRKHGMYIRYHASGKVKEQGEFIADKKHKEWKEFNEQGNLERTLIFRAGILVQTRDVKK
jgi:antitoxin component YwqK of YwqJK toxin-antitoxin module